MNSDRRQSAALEGFVQSAAPLRGLRPPFPAGAFRLRAGAGGSHADLACLVLQVDRCGRVPVERFQGTVLLRAALLAEVDHLPNVARGDALVVEVACEAEEIVLQVLLGFIESLELLGRELLVEPEEFDFGLVHIGS